VDLEGRIIKLRGGKTGARVVPLSRAAVELLVAAKPAASSPEEYVCPGQNAGAPFIRTSHKHMCISPWSLRPVGNGTIGRVLEDAPG